MMGVVLSREETDETINDLKEVLRELKLRISQLETENATTSKGIMDVKLANNDLAKTVTKIHEKVFNTSVIQRNRSVRIPKETKSLYVK